MTFSKTTNYQILILSTGLILSILIYFYISDYMFYSTETDNIQQKKIVDKQVDKHGKIVLYYAMWCGYSKSFLPEWNKFEKWAESNAPNIEVVKIRCEDGTEAECAQKGVEGYPTVIVYKGENEVLFNGDRTEEGLKKFVKHNL